MIYIIKYSGTFHVRPLSRSTGSNIKVVFNIIIEVDKTCNARERRDEMKRSTEMSKVVWFRSRVSCGTI